MNVQVASVMRHIERLSLSVAEAKTEAVVFCKKIPDVPHFVKVGRARVPIGTSMKYLGVLVDSTWCFRDHFKYVKNKVATVLRALSKLMPNLRRPGERRRRLYANVMTSVVIYAAPVWTGGFASAPDAVTRPWSRLQRVIAIRVIAAYRTVSYNAATLLARMPPWPLEAALRRRIFERLTELKNCGDFSRDADAEVRNEERLLLVRQWEIHLNKPGMWGL